METPIVDFLRRYEREGRYRFHMPGHKGSGFLGCERWDITEIAGADALYEAHGIIAQSEANAASLFGSARTLYSTEGSSQCVKAMLYLAAGCQKNRTARTVIAARNVHQSFLHAAGLLDLDVIWLWPEQSQSVCSCPVTAQALEHALNGLPSPPAAVYVTSPDYLGGMQDISALAELAHQYGTLLLVDNAHGAYLHFLEQPYHPLDLGADLCCDSAHKTLGVLTGGAYLHISPRAAYLGEEAKRAMAVFGSTSPSYLILASLDACNAELAGKEPVQIRAAAEQVRNLRAALSQKGWRMAGEEPLKLVLEMPSGWNGEKFAARLRSGGIEPEYVETDFVVLMASGATAPEAFQAVAKAVQGITPVWGERAVLPLARGEKRMSIRQALFAHHEKIPVERAEGRICAVPAVSCPPAVPVVVCGEVIDARAAAWFRKCGIDTVDVVK